MVFDTVRGDKRMTLEPKKSPISDAERQRRKDAVVYARASVGLEGFTLSASDAAHAERFINGEIDLAEFVRTHIERAR